MKDSYYKTPSISALVITYNEIGYIEKCLESIAFADEIIVIDSYSTDGTYEYLAVRVARRGPRTSERRK